MAISETTYFIKKIKNIFNKWTLATASIILVLCLPLLAILLGLLTGAGNTWDHIQKYLLLEYISNSIYLIIGTGILSSLIGISSAWCVATYNFKFRAYIQWLLYLPLAIPSYIMAYAYVGFLEFEGTFDNITLNTTSGLDIMNIWGLIFILSISLYPYVYGSSWVMFTSLGKKLWESTSLSGITQNKYFFNIALPLTLPAIFAGLFLVFMEVLNDYGAAKYFGINTFTTGIFRTWTALEDINSSIFLAAILVVVIVIIQIINRFFRGRKSYSINDISSKSQNVRKNIKGIHQLLVLTICLFPVVIGFIIPLLQLLKWSMLHISSQLDLFLFYLSMNSILLAFFTSLLIVLVALLLVFLPRWSKNTYMKFLTNFSTVGYSIPGAVIGITLIAASGYFVNYFDYIFNLKIGKYIFSGLALLIFAYLFRFISVAYNPLEANTLRINPSIPESSYLLGKSKFFTLFKVEIPLLKSSIISSSLILFIDLMKELPLTLILKPYNIQTLAIKAFEYADDERITEAALPSVILILIITTIILFLSKYSKVKAY